MTSSSSPASTSGVAHRTGTLAVSVDGSNGPVATASTTSVSTSVPIAFG
ncbi:hypothetical protein [Haloarcula litorea]|nr:hypothetical protein [Halomicroarcula sp. GDY20]